MLELVSRLAHNIVGSLVVGKYFGFVETCSLSFDIYHFGNDFQNVVRISRFGRKSTQVQSDFSGMQYEVHDEISSDFGVQQLSFSERKDVKVAPVDRQFAVVLH